MHILSCSGRSDLVSARPGGEYPTAAERQRNAVFITTRVERELGLALPDWPRVVDHVLLFLTM